MVQLVNELAVRPAYLSLIPPIIMVKLRTDMVKLRTDAPASYSDFYMHAIACKHVHMCIHTQIRVIRNEKKAFHQKDICYPDCCQSGTKTDQVCLNRSIHFTQVMRNASIHHTGIQRKVQGKPGARWPTGAAGRPLMSSCSRAGLVLIPAVCNMPGNGSVP